MVTLALKKVLVLSINDYAGSGHRYSEAVNRVGRYDSSSLKFFYHALGFQTDYCIVRTSDDKRDWGVINDRMRLAQMMVDEADILHFKGDFPVSENWGPHIHGAHYSGFPALSIPVEKPIVITTSGSIFRRHLGIESGQSFGRFSIADTMRYTNARTVTTPDLNYEEFDAKWLPLPVDSAAKDNLHIKREHSMVIVGHSPSIRARKGTDSVLIPAINILQSIGVKVALEISENVTHADSILSKSCSSIYWDQCGFGFYGNSLIEASQYGVPCMAWLSEHSLSKMLHSDRAALPVVSFDKTPESCADAMLEIIESDLKGLSAITKKWTDNTHSYEAVGARLSKIYDEIS
jgi:hypothetical protein